MNFSQKKSIFDWVQECSGTSIYNALMIHLKNSFLENIFFDEDYWCKYNFDFMLIYTKSMLHRIKVNILHSFNSS